VKIDAGELSGYNTDVDGFELPLRPHADSLKAGHALILGSGGAARAAIYGLCSTFGVKTLTIAGRDGGSQKRLSDWVSTQFNDVSLESVARSDIERTAKDKYDIAVNCTPLGGWNHADAGPLPTGVEFDALSIYYDLNYNDDNLAIDSAQKSGIVTIDGKPMLVGQAIRSFEIWTGQTMPVEPIFERVFG
jgi:shikimate dehydrogenase